MSQDVAPTPGRVGGIVQRDVMTPADGFGSGSSPWRAVQQAAPQVMKRAA